MKKPEILDMLDGKAKQQLRAIIYARDLMMAGVINYKRYTEIIKEVEEESE